MIMKMKRTNNGYHTRMMMDCCVKADCELHGFGWKALKMHELGSKIQVD